MGYVGTWVASVKFLRGSLFLRGLRGSKYFTWVNFFYVGQNFLPASIFLRGSKFLRGHFFWEDGSQKNLDWQFTSSFT